MSAVFLCFCFILKREEDSLVSSLFLMKQFFQAIWCLVFGFQSPGYLMKRRLYCNPKEMKARALPKIINFRCPCLCFPLTKRPNFGQCQSVHKTLSCGQMTALRDFWIACSKQNVVDIQGFYMTLSSFLYSECI